MAQTDLSSKLLSVGPITLNLYHATLLLRISFGGCRGMCPLHHSYLTGSCLTILGIDVLHGPHIPCLNHAPPPLVLAF